MHACTFTAPDTPKPTIIRPQTRMHPHFSHLTFLRLSTYPLGGLAKPRLQCHPTALEPRPYTSTVPTLRPNGRSG